LKPASGEHRQVAQRSPLGQPLELVRIGGSEYVQFMGSSLSFDDDGLLHITRQTGPASQKVQKIAVAQLSHFEYKRPGFMVKGTLQFFLKDGSRTDILEVEKQHRHVFDQLVEAIQQDIQQFARNVPATSPSDYSYRQPVQQSTSIDFDPSPILARNEFVAIDVEWTDSSDGTSVCEIGLAKFINGELSGSWREYVRPAKKYKMAEYEFRTHGIPPELVDGAKTLEELWPSITDFIDGRPLVLHQATNDVNKILASLGTNAKALVPNLVYLDTMLIAKKLPWVTVKNGLSDLTGFFGIEREWANYDGRDKLAQPHGAKEDAIVTGNVLVKMMEMVGFTTLLGFAELVGTTPGQVVGAEVVRGPSAPGKIQWPHLDQLPTEESLIQKKLKQQASYQKTQDKRTQAEQLKQQFLGQDPVPWSTLTVAEGSRVYFSSYPMDAEGEIKRVAKKLGVETDKFSTQIDLLVVDDDAVEGSARLRDALSFKNPVEVSNYSNFLIHNPDFPPRNW
jgi:DNA polymerase III epsilon subunit-like protein